MNPVLQRTAVPASAAPAVEKASRRERLSPAEALVLLKEVPLFVLGQLAVDRKRACSGEAVYYNRNFHIEPTNVCLYRCRFCSYRRAADDADAWDLDLEGIDACMDRFAGSPVTEVHVVGGVHPRHSLAFYTEVVKRVRRRFPQATVKAFSAVELVYMIEKAGLSYAEGLARLKAAGLGTLPGGGAEIFDAGIRSRICPEKADADRWLELHRQAHRLGIPTNATMLYGHIERPEHRIDHMRRLRELQDETGGFNAFIPLKFRSHHNELSSVGETSVVDDLRTLAVARLFLDNFDHVKAYWPMYGKQTTRAALLFGADDVDGTIQDTTRIYSLAGAEDRSPQMSVAELRELIAGAGFVPVERDSFYQPVKSFTA